MGKGDRILNIKDKISSREWIPYEYENHLAEERRNRGFSIGGFLDAIGESNRRSIYRNIELGAMSPIYLRGSNKGTIRPIVIKACDWLGIPFEEIFPREVCRLATNFNSDDEAFTPVQLQNLLHTRTVSYNDVEIVHDLNNLVKLIRTFKSGEKKAKVFSLYLQEYTFKEIGERLGISSTRCSQLFNSLWDRLISMQSHKQINFPLLARFVWYIGVICSNSKNGYKDVKTAVSNYRQEFGKFSIVTVPNVFMNENVFEYANYYGIHVEGYSPKTETDTSRLYVRGVEYMLSKIDRLIVIWDGKDPEVANIIDKTRSRGVTVYIHEI